MQLVLPHRFVTSTGLTIAFGSVHRPSDKRTTTASLSSMKRDVSSPPPTAQPRLRLLASSERNTRAWLRASLLAQHMNTALSSFTTLCLDVSVCAILNFNDDLTCTCKCSSRLPDDFRRPLKMEDCRPSIWLRVRIARRFESSIQRILRSVACAMASTTSFIVATIARSEAC
eukprot:3948671-Prymnesium_polylepis.3